MLLKVTTFSYRVMLMRSSGQDLRIFKITPTAEVLAVWPSDAGRSYWWNRGGLVVDPTGRHLVLYNAQSRVIVLDASNGRVKYRMSDWVGEPEVCKKIPAAVLSGDGRTLTAGVKLNKMHYVVHLKPVDGDADCTGTYERPRQQGWGLIAFDGEGRLKHNLYGTKGWARMTSMARDARGCTIIATETGVRIFDRDLTRSRQVYAFTRRPDIEARCWDPGVEFAWYDATRSVLFGKTKANYYIALDLF